MNFFTANRTFSLASISGSAYPSRSSAPVAQLDRAPDYESGGRAFESLRVHHFPLRFRERWPHSGNSETQRIFGSAKAHSRRTDFDAIDRQIKYCRHLARVFDFTLRLRDTPWCLVDGEDQIAGVQRHFAMAARHLHMQIMAAVFVRQ